MSSIILRVFILLIITALLTFVVFSELGILDPEFIASQSDNSSEKPQIVNAVRLEPTNFYKNIIINKVKNGDRKDIELIQSDGNIISHLSDDGKKLTLAAANGHLLFFKRNNSGFFLEKDYWDGVERSTYNMVITKNDRFLLLTQQYKDAHDAKRPSYSNNKKYTSNSLWDLQKGEKIQDDFLRNNTNFIAISGNYVINPFTSSVKINDLNIYNKRFEHDVFLDIVYDPFLFNRLTQRENRLPSSTNEGKTFWILYTDNKSISKYTIDLGSHYFFTTTKSRYYKHDINLSDPLKENSISTFAVSPNDKWMGMVLDNKIKIYSVANQDLIAEKQINNLMPNKAYIFENEDPSTYTTSTRRMDLIDINEYDIKSTINDNKLFVLIKNMSIENIVNNDGDSVSKAKTVATTINIFDNNNQSFSEKRLECIENAKFINSTHIIANTCSRDKSIILIPVENLDKKFDVIF